MPGGDNSHHLTIATMTLARNEAERAVLRDSLRSLARLNLPTVVTDGGSDASFVEFLRGFPHFRVIEAASAGVVEQTRQSLRAASETGAQLILYTEPDKRDFFELRVREFIARADESASPAVILAARSAESFSTFPRIQRYTESVVNKLCGEHVGLDTDFCYGPLILDRTLVPALDTVGAEIGWGWRFFVFALAQRLGLPLKAHAGSYPCPVKQRDEDAGERLHRMRQLSQNIQGLILGLNHPVLKDEGGRTSGRMRRKDEG